MARLRSELDKVRQENRTLAGFVRNSWHILEPVAEYVPGWHIDAVCAHLEAVTRGEITRLLINVPPGTMKSLLASVMWPAWEWAMGHRSLRYLCTSYSSGFTSRDAIRMRSLVQSEWYRSLYPEVALTRDGSEVFENSATGSRTSRPFPSLTGGRGDRVIIDDPHSTETAESEAERLTTTRIFRESVPLRVNSPTKSAIIIIMQRLHEDDVSGVALYLKLGYVHLRLPMEFEPEDRCETGVPWTYKGKRQPFKDPRTVEGELLWPAHMPRETVDRDKVPLGAYGVAGQFQQRPSPRGGGMFHRDDFEFVSAIPAGARLHCRAWDFAASVPKPGTKPDWTVGLHLSRHPSGTFYIENVARFQKRAYEVQSRLTTLASQDPPGTRIRIPQDPGQAGKAQAETLVRLLAGYSVKALPVTGDKRTRAQPASAQAEAGNIKIVKTGVPERDAWIEPFLDEVAGFPTAAHDDQVDALSDAINELALGSQYTLDNI